MNHHPGANAIGVATILPTRPGKTPQSRDGPCRPEAYGPRASTCPSPAGVLSMLSSLKLSSLNKVIRSVVAELHMTPHPEQLPTHAREEQRAPNPLAAPHSTGALAQQIPKPQLLAAGGAGRTSRLPEGGRRYGQRHRCGDHEHPLCTGHMAGASRVPIP